MLWLTWARLGVSALLLALLGTGVTLIFVDPRSAFPVFAVVGLLGAVVVILSVIAQVRFAWKANRLAAAMTAGDQLYRRSVTTTEEYAAWRKELDAWYVRTGRFLKRHLSKADAAVFRDTTQGESFSMDHGFNSEHGDALNTLMKLIANLRSILERYLSVRQ